MHNWSSDTLKKAVCVPVTVPGDCYEKANVYATDGVITIRGQWMRDTLVPACKKIGCYQGKA